MQLRKHCATFPDRILEEIGCLLELYLSPGSVVLDPFGGTGRLGRVRELGFPGYTIISGDIEPEWASQGYINGCSLCVRHDATRLPFGDSTIHAVVTSPTYGNRMGDVDASQLRAGSGENLKRSDAVRSTYTCKLGRKLTPGNTGGMQWGAGKNPTRSGEAYRQVHLQAWKECWRVLRPWGLLLLNVKDHPRDGVVQPVCQWHRDTLSGLGFQLLHDSKIPTRGDKNTNRMRGQGKETVDYEEITVWEKPDC